ncbi:hypothetical protein [Larkinella soli]|uniref:hypothetical protein n=1 Tax=Larkinella soli TaxID=1770527 RepID=UPI000FFB94E9|nr:hypothetical protein [Larkinella soli]
MERTQRNLTAFFSKTGTRQAALSLLSFLMLPALCPAQPDNRALEQRSLPDTTRSGRFSFRFHSLGFVRNNEYFGPLADGYTLFGNQLNPRVAYQPAPHVLLEAGVFLQNDFGQERIARIAPTFTVRFRHRHWDFLFGTLEGSVSHRLIEPLYHFERLLRQRIENGLQVIHRTDRTFFDFWISYPRNTLPGYTRQEQFWGGVSAELPLLLRPGFRLSVPLQATAFHAGGQNIRSPLPVRTALNAAAGLSLSWQNRPDRFIRTVRLDTYAAGYRENADSLRSGGAFYPNLTLGLKPLTVLVSYWNGNDYRAEYGGDLYQSATRRFGSTYREARRRLLIVRFLKDVKIADGLVVTLRFEPHYDLKNRLFEHAEGIYLTFTK